MKKKGARTSPGAGEPARSAEQAVNSSVRASMADAMKEIEKKGIQFSTLTVKDFSKKFYSTGILTIDKALSGGLPWGRITEFFGEQQSGKSLISMTCAAELQKKGGRVVLFDVEGGFEDKWAEKLGVDLDPEKLRVMDIMVLEEIIQSIEVFCRTNAADLFIIDSIAAVIPREVMNDMLAQEFESNRWASLARSLAKYLPYLSGILRKADKSLIIINQVRDAIGAYVPTLKTTGGHALKHFNHSQIQVFKAPSSKLIKEGEEETGVEIGIKVMKNRCGRNHTRANFRIDYTKGLDRLYDVVTFLVEVGQITQAGAFYQYAGQKYQGMANLLQAFSADQAAFENARAIAADMLKQSIQHDEATAPAETETPKPEED